MAGDSCPGMQRAQELMDDLEIPSCLVRVQSRRTPNQVMFIQNTEGAQLCV